MGRGAGGKAASFSGRTMILKLQLAYPSVLIFVLGGARNPLSFFETNSCMILMQVVLRPYLQKLWQGWISSNWPYTPVPLFD